MRFPLDQTPYPKDPRSQPLHAGIADGLYVYAQDAAGMVQVVPDGPHTHPRVLGGRSRLFTPATSRYKVEQLRI